MKLNLLPQTEKKSRQGKSAWIVGTLIVLASIGAYGAMFFYGTLKVNQAKEGIEDLQQQVAKVDAEAKSADTIIVQAADVIRNAQLAQAMIDHNDVYPKLYDDVEKYIPPYYRLQSMTATPQGAGVSTLTLTGTLTGYQKYADLMLALMRFKDAQTITRSGYNLDDPTVPSVSTEDPVGVMRKANEAPVPQDGLERLAYFQAKAAAEPKGYLGLGYGDGTNDVRGALPGASVVTIVMTVARDLRVPLAADTLRAGGAGALGGAGIPGAPGIGGPPPGMNLGPSGPPGAGGGRGRIGAD